MLLGEEPVVLPGAVPQEGPSPQLASLSTDQASSFTSFSESQVQVAKQLSATEQSPVAAAINTATNTGSGPLLSPSTSSLAVPSGLSTASSSPLISPKSPSGLPAYSLPSIRSSLTLASTQTILEDPLSRPTHPTPSGIHPFNFGEASKSIRRKVKEKDARPSPQVPALDVDATDSVRSSPVKSGMKRRESRKGSITSLGLSPRGPKPEKYDGFVIGADNDKMPLKMLIQALLKTLRYSHKTIDVKAARNAAEIKAIIAENKDIPCFAIFTDNDMAKSDEGIEIAKWANEQNPPIRVVIITGNAESKKTEEARDAGANSFAIKGAILERVVLFELTRAGLILPQRSPTGLIDLESTPSPPPPRYRCSIV